MRSAFRFAAAAAFRFAATAAVLAVATPAGAQTDEPVAVNIPGITMTLIDLSGTNRGRASLRPTPNGRGFLTVSATGLPQGWHAVHVHERGVCDPATGFTSAGDILHQPGQAHGYLHPDGPYDGDLVNVMVQEDLTLVAEIITERLNLSTQGPGAVFDTDGSALVIYSGRDDYQTQPDGSAGDRLMCAVIELPRQ